MKAKITRGKGFKGLLSYALGKEGSEVICGTVVGETVSDYASEFGIVRRLREDVMRPVWHASLALPSGERATPEEWRALSNMFLVRMDFDPDAAQWIAVRHHDRDHDHIHIIMNRIQCDGSLWLGRRDVFRAIEATQQIEDEFHLQKTPGFQKKSHYSPTSSERRMMARTGERSVKSTVAATITKILKSGALSRATFEEACRKEGIEPRANLSKTTGKMSGYSFSYENHAFPGSKVGAGWKKLSSILGEREKSHSEVAHDLRSAIFSALESGNFHSEMSKKGWSINGNTIFSSCGQTINLEEWGVDAAEIDRAAEAIKNAPAEERARSKGILPPDLESLAILALAAPNVLAALAALQILCSVEKIMDEHRREARREAWEKVHQVMLHIEEEKTHGRDDESVVADWGKSEEIDRGRGAEIEGDPRTDRDHGGEEQRNLPRMGIEGRERMSEDRPERGISAVPPGERERCASTLVSDDIRPEENASPEPRTGEEPHHLDLDPERLSDLAALAAHLADLAASPIAPAPEDAPPEEPDPLPEEQIEDIEVEPEEEEVESWTWGR